MCCVGVPVTMLLKNYISSVIFHTNNWKIITTMYKRILGFTNMSEASKGISVSHIRHGDLSLTLSECSKEKQKHSFSIHQMSFKKLCHLSLYQRLVFQIQLFRLWISHWTPSQERLRLLDVAKSFRAITCWIVFPTMIGGSPNVQYLWARPHLEIGSVKLWSN